MKKSLAIILILSFALALCACGQVESSAFRTMDVLGTKRYTAICRGGDKLSPCIAAAMAQLYRSGTLQTLSTRWLGKDRILWDSDSADAPDLPEDLEPRTLIFGVEGGFNPMAFAGEDGQLQGMSVELANAIGQVLGWEVQVTSITPAEVSTQLSSGNIDCALGFDGGLVKADAYDVGACYLESDVVLAVRPESDIKRVRDLKGLRVGIVDDPSVRALVKNDAKLTKYADGATVYLSAQRCISALDADWCGAVVMDSLMLTYFRDN